MSRSLLVVEDSDDLRNMYRLFLKTKGFSVRGAASGEEALQMLEQEPPDVILLDLSLPNMSGPEFVKEMRSRPEGKQPKLIVTSGWDNLKQHAEDLGADGFATKPANLDSLAKQIEDLLKQ